MSVFRNTALAGLAAFAAISGVEPAHAQAQLHSQFQPLVQKTAEQRFAALEAENAALNAKVALLSDTITTMKQAADKESFNVRFRLMAIEKWENLKSLDDNQNFTTLWQNAFQFRRWGDSFYQLYLRHTHSYLDDATAAGRYAVYETSVPYPLPKGGFGPDQLDVLGAALARVDERIVYAPPSANGGATNTISPLPDPLPPIMRP